MQAETIFLKNRMNKAVMWNFSQLNKEGAPALGHSPKYIKKRGKNSDYICQCQNK